MYTCEECDLHYSKWLGGGCHEYYSKERYEKTCSMIYPLPDKRILWEKPTTTPIQPPYHHQRVGCSKKVEGMIRMSSLMLSNVIKGHRMSNVASVTNLGIIKEATNDPCITKLHPVQLL